MMKYFALFLIFIGSLHCGEMKKFLSSHVPMTQDGKIAIPDHVKHIKIDVGLSYNAPMSGYWLSHEKDLLVFGFEPNPSSVRIIKKGSIAKKSPYHGNPIEDKYIGKYFFVIPCALGPNTNSSATFYITKNDCGCSSLHKPKFFEIEEVISVPIFSLADFFDLFPFDTHPVIEYIKLDAQGSDLDILISSKDYLSSRVIYVTIEPENHLYENTDNSEKTIDCFMESQGFKRVYHPDTVDPTYLNQRFLSYIEKNEVKIFQKG